MIAAAVPDQASRDACAELAELCGDLPLALDIAARKLAPHPELNLCERVARLRSPQYLLGWLRLGDLAVGEALACAHTLLSEPAAALLSHLAESASPWVESAARRATREAVPPVPDGLASGEVRGQV